MYIRAFEFPGILSLVLVFRLSHRKQNPNASGDFPLSEIDGVILSPLFADTCGWKGSKFCKRLEDDTTKSWPRNAHNPVCSHYMLCRSLPTSENNSVLGVRQWEHHISKSLRWRGCRTTPACHLCHTLTHHSLYIHFKSCVTQGFFFSLIGSTSHSLEAQSPGKLFPAHSPITVLELLSFRSDKGPK